MGRRDGFGGNNRRSPLGNGCGARLRAIHAETCRPLRLRKEAQPAGRTNPCSRNTTAECLTKGINSDLTKKSQGKWAPMRKARDRTIRNLAGNRGAGTQSLYSLQLRAQHELPVAAFPKAEPTYRASALSAPSEGRSEPPCDEPCAELPFGAAVSDR